MTSRLYPFVRVVAAVVLLCTVGSAGHVRDAVAQQADLIAEGSSVYGTICGACHNARSPLERSDRQWVVIMNHMRVRANLTGSETRAVLAFLQATNSDPSIQSPLGTDEMIDEGPRIVSDAPPNSALAPAGEALVAQKACLGCHIVGDAGGKVGPSLNGVVSRKGPQFVRHKLIDPTFDNANSLMPNFGLSPDQVEALLAYLATQDG